MRAESRRLLVVGVLCGLMSYAPAVVLSQTNRSTDPWEIVYAIPIGTELEIQLDKRQQFKGRLLAASNEMLRLSRTNEIAEVRRDHVVKIYQLSPKSEDFRKMTRSLGAVTGVAVGLEIAKDKRAGFFLVPALGGTFGAFGGYALSNRMKTRMLIYDARPRQLPDTESNQITLRTTPDQRLRKVSLH
jgi:hypothetical protein